MRRIQQPTPEHRRRKKLLMATFRILSGRRTLMPILKARSPNARETASSPITRLWITMPPARLMRSVSSSRFGLWSCVRWRGGQKEHGGRGTRHLKLCGVTEVFVMLPSASLPLLVTPLSLLVTSMTTSAAAAAAAAGARGRCAF